MKTFYLTILLLFALSNFHAQLNCKTLKGIAGDSTICHHQNGKVSTISWVSIEHKNYYHFRAFDNLGKKVLEENHGYLHGSGSLHVKYYENGAIRSARKTFQPDGGIQHWDVTSFYNEDGTFHHAEDNSWHTRTTIIREPIQEKQNEIVKKEIVADSVAVILKNSTSVKIEVLVKDLSHKTENRIVTIRKNKEVEIGKFLPTSKKTEAQQFYSIEVLPRKKTIKTLIISNKELNSKSKQILLIVSN